MYKKLHVKIFRNERICLRMHSMSIPMSNVRIEQFAGKKKHSEIIQNTVYIHTKLHKTTTRTHPSKTQPFHLHKNQQRKRHPLFFTQNNPDIHISYDHIFHNANIQCIVVAHHNRTNCCHRHHHRLLPH
jgi:hypothetical protein